MENVIFHQHIILFKKVSPSPTQSVLALSFDHWKFSHMVVIIILFWPNMRFHFHIFSFLFQNKIPVGNLFSLTISYEVLAPAVSGCTWNGLFLAQLSGMATESVCGQGLTLAEITGE